MDTAIPALDRDNRAQRLIRQLMPIIVASIDPPPWQQPCFVGELIDLCAYWLKLLARLLDTIASGDAIPDYAQEQIDHLMAMDEMSELELIDSLNDKHAALK